MFVSRAFGQCVRSPIIRLNSQVARRHISRLSPLPNASCRVARSPQWLLQHQGSRLASGPGSGSAYRYPESLNVFNSGAVPTVTLGSIRIVLCVVAAYGVFYFAPGVYQDSAAPWYMGPLIGIGAILPLVATGIAFGGYVHHINLLLPKTARRTQADLKRFVANMPPNAIVQVKSMYFRPWPVTSQIYFEDFRRLPLSKLRLSNLESVPPRNAEAADKNPMMQWLAKKIMGTYFVNMSMMTDRSRAPGLWKEIWKQIPMSGDRSMVREAAEKKAVLASNRSAPMARMVKDTARNATEKNTAPRGKKSDSAPARKAPQAKARP